MKLIGRAGCSCPYAFQNRPSNVRRFGARRVLSGRGLRALLEVLHGSPGPKRRGDRQSTLGPFPRAGLVFLLAAAVGHLASRAWRRPSLCSEWVFSRVLSIRAGGGWLRLSGHPCRLFGYPVGEARRAHPGFLGTQGHGPSAGCEKIVSVLRVRFTVALVASLGGGLRLSLVPPRILGRSRGARTQSTSTRAQLLGVSGGLAAFWVPASVGDGSRASSGRESTCVVIQRLVSGRPARGSVTFQRRRLEVKACRRQPRGALLGCIGTSTLTIRQGCEGRLACREVACSGVWAASGMWCSLTCRALLPCPSSRRARGENDQRWPGSWGDMSGFLARSPESLQASCGVHS